MGQLNVQFRMSETNIVSPRIPDMIGGEVRQGQLLAAIRIKSWIFRIGLIPYSGSTFHLASLHAALKLHDGKRHSSTRHSSHASTPAPRSREALASRSGTHGLHGARAAGLFAPRRHSLVGADLRPQLPHMLPNYAHHRRTLRPEQRGAARRSAAGRCFPRRARRTQRHQSVPRRCGPSPTGALSRAAA